MLAIGYIMMNGDRHMNNFGLVRDADTLEHICLAPVYDTGTSLGCDVRTECSRKRSAIPPSLSRAPS